MTQPSVPSALEIATSGPVFRRAVKNGLVVGCIIGAINYGDKIIAGTLEPRDILKIALTFLVPYSVSTYSAIMAVRDRAREGG